MKKLRCEYCKYRDSWDCEDGWNRVSNKNYCGNFYLDFEELSSKQKKQVQRILMNESERGFYE